MVECCQEILDRMCSSLGGQVGAKPAEAKQTDELLVEHFVGRIK